MLTYALDHMLKSNYLKSNYQKFVKYLILPPFQNTCPIFAMCTIHLTYFDHTFLTNV